MKAIKLMLFSFLLAFTATAQNTVKLSELTVTHTRNQDKGFAIVSQVAIPYVTTEITTKTPVTFTNIYQVGEGVNQIELREIYFQACSQCPANLIYYYGGLGSVMRMWRLDANEITYTEILDVHEIGRCLVAAK